MHKFDQKIIEGAILHYGMEQESIVCIEELSELQKEVTKYLRRQGNKTALVLEIADVLVCVELLKKMYNIPEEMVNDAIAVKQRRTARRIESETAAVTGGKNCEKYKDFIKRPFRSCKDVCSG